jgi:hypothetical protein
MRNLRTVTLAGICTVGLIWLALPGLAFAQARPEKGGSKTEAKGDPKSQGDGELTLEFMIGFSEKAARSLAVEYELVGQKPLPRGIRKNLARGKPLPPGIAKQSLPTAFVAQLPSHEGYGWRMAGTALLLISTDDMTIQVVFKDLFE